MVTTTLREKLVKRCESNFHSFFFLFFFFISTSSVVLLWRNALENEYWSTSGWNWAELRERWVKIQAGILSLSFSLSAFFFTWNISKSHQRCSVLRSHWWDSEAVWKCSWKSRRYLSQIVIIILYNNSCYNQLAQQCLKAMSVKHIVLCGF